MSSKVPWSNVDTRDHSKTFVIPSNTGTNYSHSMDTSNPSTANPSYTLPQNSSYVTDYNRNPVQNDLTYPVRDVFMGYPE